ncbi:sporulation integral membrane protein YlbJ [Petroclostridium sp. X23]|uniref:sporulation integral membrane protein YlbJ n=1 Tax=Petroclostridium sp. X23 TaxID=3045146 RepID=UPI0024AE429E|nr:sporulation integral membrane protein YlbJ [Petroclostridium sp. X23]WHH59882.1 sporulation integral membrane protein YlbJ [Petroclostridium sp. X23]
MINIFAFIAILYLIYFFSMLILKKMYFIHLYMSSVLLIACVILFILAVISNPRQSFDAALKGITLSVNVVFPSLFPFFVGTELLTNLGLVHILGIVLEPVMRPIFNVPGCGSFAFSMGIISGYPVGAKATVNLREKALCTKTEAERLLTFCNNSGPLFILGAVAVGMFNRPAVGTLLFISHFLASLTVGFCFRYYKKSADTSSYEYKGRTFKKVITDILKELKDAGKRDSRNFGELFGDAIKNAVNLLLVISGFIIFFSVLIHLLDYFNIINLFSQLLGFLLGPLGIAKQLLPSIASGFFEITSGIKIASAQPSVSLLQQLMVTSLILGWAGLSVHCQVMSIISKTDIRVTPYLMGKGLQGIVSAIYTFILFSYTPLSSQVSSSTSEALQNYAPPNIMNTFFTSLIYFGNILLFLFVLCVMLAIGTSFKNRN